jgi:hypothetical protein
MYTYVKVFEKGVWCENAVNLWLEENRHDINVQDIKIDGTTIMIIYKAKKILK